jgi:putative transposase
MPRIARIVVPDIPHHVTQRGNRRQDVFFNESDYAAYVKLLAAACAENHVRCLAWCLMPNHVHLILTPKDETGLALAVSDTHRRYARRINAAHDWTGYLFQGRFASYPMDEGHLLNAVRYVELNPVTAGLVAQAEDWRWSSAAAHISGKSDRLTDLAALDGLHGNWGAMLRDGWSAREESDEVVASIEAHIRSGRPKGGVPFLAGLEASTGRTFQKSKPGPKLRR